MAHCPQKSKHMKSVYHLAEDKTNQKFTTAVFEEPDKAFTDGTSSKTLIFHNSPLQPFAKQRGKGGGHHQHSSQHMEKFSLSKIQFLRVCLADGPSFVQKLPQELPPPVTLPAAQALPCISQTVEEERSQSKYW